MTIFWILSAGLSGLALLFVLTPLLSRREPSPDNDQDELNLAVYRQQLEELDADLAAGNLDRAQYKASRRDLERELLYDVRGADVASSPRSSTGNRVTALVLALVVPASAVALYWHLGSSDIVPALESVASAQPAARPAGHPRTPADGQMPSMDVLVQRLADRLAQNPNDLNGWLMLGRSYFALQQPQNALQALEKAYGLAPENPDVIVAYAQALASTAGGELDGRPTELVRTALELDSTNITARWLDGLIAYRAEDFSGAIERWESLLAELDPKGKQAAELQQLVADARQRAGMPASAPSASTPIERERRPEAAADATPSDDATKESKIIVKVALAEPLWPKADVNHTLFVYAKAASGPPMPLAVKRLRAADLPVTVELDDSMAMTPAMRLSNFPEVTVGARISGSGQAMPQSGDMEGETGPVKPGAPDPVEVVIEHVRP